MRIDVLVRVHDCSDQNILNHCNTPVLVPVVGPFAPNYTKLVSYKWFALSACRPCPCDTFDHIAAQRCRNLSWGRPRFALFFSSCRNKLRSKFIFPRKLSLRSTFKIVLFLLPKTFRHLIESFKQSNNFGFIWQEIINFTDFNRHRYVKQHSDNPSSNVLQWYSRLFSW